MTPRQRLAVHESGHAVVAERVGQRVDGVRIEPTEGITDFETDDQDITAIQAAAILSAGPLAEALATGQAVDMDAGDFDDLRNVLNEHLDADQTAADKRIAGILDRAGAAEAVRRSSINLAIAGGIGLAATHLHRNWPAVEALAAELADAGALTGDVVRHVLGVA